MYVVLHVKFKLILSDFKKTWIFSINFINEPSTLIFTKFRPARADIIKLIVTSCNFANAPKN